MSQNLNKLRVGVTRFLLYLFTEVKINNQLLSDRVKYKQWNPALRPTNIYGHIYIYTVIRSPCYYGHFSWPPHKNDTFSRKTPSSIRSPCYYGQIFWPIGDHNNGVPMENGS